MAQSNLPSRELLEQVAGELSAALPRSPLAYSLGSAGIGEVGLAETVDTWLLPLESVRANAPVESALMPMNRWHHQLKAGGHAVGFATSMADEDLGSAPRLAEIADDWQLSSAFDRAVEAIDVHHPNDDTSVRLVSAPAFSLWALYCQGPGTAEVYILSSPVSFLPDLGAPLGIPRLSSGEFMRQLALTPYEEGLVDE